MAGPSPPTAGPSSPTGPRPTPWPTSSDGGPRGVPSARSPSASPRRASRPRTGPRAGITTVSPTSSARSRPVPKTTRRAAPASGRHSLSQQLRDLIDSRGLTAYGAAKLAGVNPAVVSRYMDGTRDIRMATADKLAAALGLRLVEVGRGARGRGRNPVPIDIDRRDDGTAEPRREDAGESGARDEA